MSDLLTRFQKSTAPRVAEARQIPGLAVNFIDIQNIFQTEFTTFRQQMAPTDFTKAALDYYKVERNTVPLPDGFKPLDPDTPFNQWSPDNGYYNPGTPKG